MTMKKIILLLNSLLILMLLVSLSSCKKVNTMIDNAVGNFTYKQVDDDEIIIKKYTGKFTRIEIPEEIDGMTVVAVDAEAFSNVPGLKEIVIPKTVTTLCSNAFYECYALQKVIIKSDNISIGNYAFGECISLETVESKGLIANINSYAFAGCEKLVSVTSEKGIVNIGKNAFRGCTSLAEITLNDKLSEVYATSFDECELKTSFYGNGLYIGTSNNPYAVLYSTTNSANGLSIHPNTVIIAQDAFSGKAIPSTIYFEAKALNENSSAAFYNNNSQFTLIINEKTGIESLNFLHSYWFASKVNRLEFEDGISEIFFARFNLQSYKHVSVLILPDCMSFIDFTDFYGFSNLQSIVIPKSVKTIDSNAFSYCTKLTKVFYGGSYDDYRRMNIGTGNTPLSNATTYYYSENKPLYNDNHYWHYDSNHGVKIW